LRKIIFHTHTHTHSLDLFRDIPYSQIDGHLFTRKHETDCFAHFAMTPQEHQHEHDRVDVYHRIRPIAEAGLDTFQVSKTRIIF